jgi:pullulanase/glycogen debranching enzyme
MAASPQPTGRYGLLRIPAPNAGTVTARYAPLADRDDFDPTKWATQTLTKSDQFPGWWEWDIDALSLSDGVYEYEFLLDASTTPIADPYTDEITRFGGYRGLFRTTAKQRTGLAFDWSDEFNGEAPALRQNNQIVIYEMPIKWMASDPGEENTMVELGTFEKIVFERLDYLTNLGINCIELLPIEDSSQTLNWGYGTRFYFAPDYDVGTPVDTKFFIKMCHKRGIRVILDVVMNFFNPSCPLNALAPLGGAANWFSVPSGTDGRQDFGQILIRYNTPSYGSYFAAREFLYQMARFWVNEYHIDGFRIDDFADIKNWDFGQAFRAAAVKAAAGVLQNKPFIVIAEDSSRNFTSTDDKALNGNKVVDAIWNFGYRDEIRRLALDQINTNFGQPSRTVRVQHLLSRDGVWNAYGNGSFDRGFADMACSVCYVTSHDVQDAPRLMNTILGTVLRDQDLGDGSVDNVKSVIDGNSTDGKVTGAVSFALYRILGVFAVLLTSVGIPMFLAGEEFADVHDQSYSNVNKKQQDPVQWQRAAYPGQANLLSRVTALTKLRTSHPALQRNEIEFFYFHPQFDDNDSPRVFGYVRTNGTAAGAAGQVIVIANMGAEKFPVYGIPNWAWGALPLSEVAGRGDAAPVYDAASGKLTVAIDAFQVRVFTS